MSTRRTHAQYRLLERYGLDVTAAELEALEALVARQLVPWKSIGQARRGVLVIRLRTWGRVLYALWCPQRRCLLTFLTRTMARKWRRRA